MLALLLYMNSFPSRCLRSHSALGTICSYAFSLSQFFSLLVKLMPHHKVASAYGVTRSVTPNQASLPTSDNQTLLPLILPSHPTSAGSLALQSTATGSYRRQSAPMAPLRPSVTIIATIAQRTLPKRFQILY